VDARRGDLGRIEETIVTGANDVWVVHGSYGEILIPVIDEVVIEVDEDDRTVSVTLLPGLLEEDDS
jgi:16S rRNA processing protein RimM